MSTFSSNTTYKVNRAISGATTVNANCFAEVTYEPTSGGTTVISSDFQYTAMPFTRVFGAGQSIPATISVSQYYSNSNSLLVGTVTMTLRSGVEFINTP